MHLSVSVFVVSREKTKQNHGGGCEKLSFYFVFPKPDYLSEIHFTISGPFFYSVCVLLG